MNQPDPTTIRADDLLRHLQDLRTGTYEGEKSRRAKEAVYRRGIELLTPIARPILEEAGQRPVLEWYRRDTGDWPGR